MQILCKDGKKFIGASTVIFEATRQYERLSAKYSVGGKVILKAEDVQRNFVKTLNDSGVEVITDEEFKRMTGEEPSTGLATTQILAPDVLAGAVAKVRTSSV